METTNLYEVLYRKYPCIKSEVIFTGSRRATVTFVVSKFNKIKLIQNFGTPSLFNGNGSYYASRDGVEVIIKEKNHETAKASN